MKHLDIRQLDDYLHGLPDREETKRLETHLRECPTCRERLEEARAAWEQVQRPEMPPVPRVELPRTGKTRRIPAWLAVAALLAGFILGLGWRGAGCRRVWVVEGAPPLPAAVSETTAACDAVCWR